MIPHAIHNGRRNIVSGLQYNVPLASPYIARIQPRHCALTKRQEFLRYFLDGLAEDLNRRGRGEASVTASKTLASPTPSILSEETLSRLPADQQADRAWATHLARNDSEISSIFSGQLQSRISCQTCGNESYCFDPFFDLSVPLTGARGSRLASGGSHGVGGTGEYSDEDHQKNGDHISRSSVEGMHHGTVRTYAGKSCPDRILGSSNVHCSCDRWKLENVPLNPKV